MDELLRKWGRNIRVRREALKLTQAQLAELCDVRQPTVQRWERGVMEPKREHKAALSRALHTDAELLFPLITNGVD